MRCVLPITYIMLAHGGVNCYTDVTSKIRGIYAESASINDIKQQPHRGVSIFKNKFSVKLTSIPYQSLWDLRRA